MFAESYKTEGLVPVLHICTSDFAMYSSAMASEG